MGPRIRSHIYIPYLTITEMLESVVGTTKVPDPAPVKEQGCSILYADWKSELKERQFNFDNDDMAKPASFALGFIVTQEEIANGHDFSNDVFDKRFKHLHFAFCRSVWEAVANFDGKNPRIVTREAPSFTSDNDFATINEKYKMYMRFYVEEANE